jgi:hypothetical protein
MTAMTRRTFVHSSLPQLSIHVRDLRSLVDEIRAKTMKGERTFNTQWKVNTYPNNNKTDIIRCK